MNGWEERREEWPMSSISTLINFEEVKEISFFPIQFLTLSRPSRQDDWVFFCNISHLLLSLCTVSCCCRYQKLQIHIFSIHKKTQTGPFLTSIRFIRRKWQFFLSINKSQRACTYHNVKRTHMCRTMFNSKIASVVIENLLSLIKILCRGSFE